MSRVKYCAFVAGLVVSASAFAGAVNNAGPTYDAVKPVRFTQLSETPRGLVKATAEAKIAAELVARIDKLPFREGDRFNKGDALVVFDCRRYDADLKAIKAELRGAERVLNANLELKRHNAVGNNELEISRAKVEEIGARVEALEVRTDQCRITAPFSGHVVELFSQEHEMPTANAPLISIVDSGPLELNLILPSRWLNWLKPGTKFEFAVDETRKTYEASVTRIAAVVDPISQTVAVNAVFDTPTHGVLPGMSGSAVFNGPDGS